MYADRFFSPFPRPHLSSKMVFSAAQKLWSSLTYDSYNLSAPSPTMLSEVRV